MTGEVSYRCVADAAMSPHFSQETNKAHVLAPSKTTPAGYLSGDFTSAGEPAFLMQHQPEAGTALKLYDFATS